MKWGVTLLASLALAATGSLLAERRRRVAAEAESRAILSSAFADIAILSEGGVVEACNDNWSRAAETADPFVSARTGERWLSSAPLPNQQDMERVRDAFDGVRLGRRQEGLVEYQWIDRAQWRWAQVRVRSLADGSRRLVVAHLDITARKRLEGEAHNALQELAHMNVRAGMGEVATSITHELAQSLTASLGNAQALKHMLAQPGVSYEDVATVVEDIGDANRQASSVLERIRSVVRKDPFDPAPLDFNAIIMDVVHVLYSSAANDGVLLVTHLADDMPHVLGDRVQLRQVVMNLIINAVHATRGHRDGTSLIRLRTSYDGDRVSFVVDDSGPGVAEDALSRIFEPYFTTKKDGLGVGLSISRSVVQSHGGTIEVENLPDGGARFAVHLPVD